MNNSVSTLSYLLNHVSTIMHRQGDQALQERLGIGMAQYRIISTLQERPEVQQRFLASSLGQTEASISRQINLLADKGILTVDINPKNKREHVTLLTAKGTKLALAAKEILDEYHAHAFDKLGEKDKQHLAQALNDLHLHYCERGKPYACDLPWFSQFGKEVV